MTEATCGNLIKVAHELFSLEYVAMPGKAKLPILKEIKVLAR